jgi:two-component system NtrC family sensor kinase
MEENRRILVIDDDEGVRKSYQGILVQEKEPEMFSIGRDLFSIASDKPEASSETTYELSMANNGIDGIEKVKAAMAENRPFAVAFIDMKMPGINGAETSARIWEIDPDIRIVIVTAYSDYSPKDIIAVTGRKDIFYLRKPFNHEEISQFARALTNTWYLEKKKGELQERLTQANKELEDMNKNLNQKVQKQASMIVQTEKMASIGLLAAGVAHEINNPLAFVGANLSTTKKYFKRIISMYQKYGEIEVLLEKSGTEEAKRLLHDLSIHKKENKIKIIIDNLESLADESIEGVNRIRDIVQDLRTFSRIDESEYKHLDINKAIDTTLNMVKNEIKYKAVVEKEYEVLPEIKCFPQKMSQVFMNLLVNASQAIEKKGIIKITTKLKKKDGRTDQSFIEITISDNGCGIPEENMTRLFDPFFTTKPTGSGTGLGLSIVYEIVKAHHGIIDVSSELGKGTLVTIMLPAVS